MRCAVCADVGQVSTTLRLSSETSAPSPFDACGRSRADQLRRSRDRLLYMQILPTAFLNEVAAPLINIHHSFLPAFAGGSPYDQAKRRGVKLIGATAHYVTAELDAGPIIEQDVVRVSHRDDVSSLRCMGADVERAVLARAVRWHSEDRLLQHGNSVVVF